MDTKKGKVSIQQHQLVEDQTIGAMKKDMMLKVGAFLTNLMCKNLQYKIGGQTHLLLQPQVLRDSGTKKGQSKYMGYIQFNKAFIE